jgi:hypothetical protein
VLLGGSVFVVNAAKPDRVKPVTAYETFSANDKSFRCDYPQGWKKETREAAAVISQAAFRQGGARIVVSADLAGSLMGDMLTAQQNMGGGLDMGDFGGEGGGSIPDISSMPGVDKLMAAVGGKKSVIEKLHDAEAQQAEGMSAAAKCGFTDDYQEQPSEPLPNSLGPGRVSEFTADGGFIFGKGRGYRATILGSDKLVTVVCAAPEQDWNAVSEAFKRTLASLGPGM